MSTFSVQNFGCRANQADGAALAADLARAGLLPARAAAADWVVFNTCTVTAEADAEARRAIRRLRRERPEARIVVTGCYAQRAPQELAGLPGVVAVLGHQDKFSLAARLAPAAAASAALALFPAALLPGKTRPTVKVQEGCDRSCGFCVVPSVRGASRSRPLGAVLGEMQALAAAGVQEAVLSGINLGQWGRDLDRRLRLPDLVRAILEQTAIPRLRLSSVEPMDWGEEMTALLAQQPRLARHAHLPLQSGSDAVLRRMRRRYRSAHYAEAVQRLHAAVPGVAIGADVMVGFPGESEAEFDDTLKFVAATPLAYLHVFDFSPRSGTEAARRIENGEWTPVEATRAAERARALRRLGAEKRAAFHGGQIGQRVPAVTLADTHPSGTWALSDNFIRVALDQTLPPNQPVRVELTAAHPDHVEGRRLQL